MLVDAQAGHRCGGKISELRARIGEFLAFWQSHQCSDTGPYGMEQSGQLGSGGNPSLRLTEFALSCLFRTPSVGFDRRSAPRLHVPNPLLCLRPTTAAAGRGGVRHQLTCTVPLGPNWSPGWSGKACVAQSMLGRQDLLGEAGSRFRLASCWRFHSWRPLVPHAMPLVRPALSPWLSGPLRRQYQMPRRSGSGRNRGLPPPRPRRMHSLGP